MLDLKLRDEFLGAQMPGTAISLCTSDNQGAAQKSPDYILSITYPTADIQTALKAINIKRSGRPIVLMGERGRGKSHIMAVMHHAIQSPGIVEDWLHGRGENVKTVDLFGNAVDHNNALEKKGKRKSKTDKIAEFLPEKLGKAIRLQVPDFSDPNRKSTCLEEDFPIAQINALSNLEGNAGKPIYQMSKWWARRRSSVFRSMLIAAATEAPDDPYESAKKVWDHYYCNHQKAGSFKKLRVLDPFMGGGTTPVEGSRLGMQMTGVDLNPVAWFVVKNELACSDPEQVQALFDHTEAEVKPQIQPFYTTTCPRGHEGQWLDVQTGEPVDIDPLELEPEARRRYRWEGPEVIYTFWAKHGPCLVKGCGYRTPIFRTPVVAEKKLSTFYIELTCPDCNQTFHAELGETRIAPEAERVVLEEEE